MAATMIVCMCMCVAIAISALMAKIYTANKSFRCEFMCCYFCLFQFLSNYYAFALNLILFISNIQRQATQMEGEHGG